MEKAPILNKLIIHPSFKPTIEILRNENIKLPRPSNDVSDFSNFVFPQKGKLSPIENIGSYKLNAEYGNYLVKNIYKNLLGYDESRLKFSALEGNGYLTSHSLIIHGKNDYIPINLLTFYFYTRSKLLLKISDYIKPNDEIDNADESDNDAESAYKRDYAIDRSNLLLNNNIEDSILFIDGPLIGGQMSSMTVDLNNQLLNKNIIPFFFVKNSSSNLVTDNVEKLKGNFNSDMHWAYNILEKGERTNFFKYTDDNNASFSKIFCYLKIYDSSPQRIEIHTTTFNKIKNKINDIMDVIYYLILVQGNLKNPQLRTIAIAEMYARHTIRLYDINNLILTSKLVPTMNQVRFG